MDMSNKIDLVAEITKYSTDCFQDFEGFSSSEEQELLIKEIKKCSKIFEYKKNKGYLQILCDIVLLKIIGDLQEGEFDVTYYVEKVIDYMVFWDDVLSCRYLLKSGIDWNKGE